MMHGRFHPDEIVAATRMRVIPAAPPQPTPLRRERATGRNVSRIALWQRRPRHRRPAPQLDAA